MIKAYKQYANMVKTDLIKEASMLEDPEAVDVVLSLNFINEDNINYFVENIDELKEVSSNLSKLLVASRMGLKTVDEHAVKKVVDGLEVVIDNLESLRLATTNS